MSGVPGQTAARSTLGTLAERLISHSSIFAAGSVVTMFLGMARLVVLTRLLDMSLYGQLTLLVILAGFVATLFRVVIVTGALTSGFRGGGDDEEGEELAQTDSTADPRRMLGTGLVGSILLTALLVGAVAAFARPIDDAVIGTGAWFPVVAATALGGLDGMFRLASYMARYERRPVMYVLEVIVYGIAGIGAAIALIEAGYGLNGAIGGLALGSAIAIVCGLWVSRHRFTFALDWEQIPVLAKLGFPLAGIIIGRFVFGYADIIMVSRYLPEADVAQYRVAGRIGGLTGSVISSIFFARGPLLRGPLRGALHREGLLVTADARLFSYIWLIAVWMVVGLVLTRDLLIRLAAPEYGHVAYLIAVLGVAALMSSGLILVHRTTWLRRKRIVLTVLLLGLSPMLIGLAALLIPRFGLDGAAAASIVTPLTGAAIYLSISQRFSSKPLDLPWLRLIVATLVGAAYSALFVVVSSAIGDAGIWLSLAAVPVFPAVLVLSGALPRGDARAVVRVLKHLRHGGASRLADGLTSIDDQGVEVLDSLLRDRRAPREVARATGGDEDELLARFVSLLREVGEIGEPRPTDKLVGRYLLSPSNLSRRDREGHLVALEKGVDSMEVDQLTVLSDRITKLSEKRWLALTDRDARAGQAD
jgi:O-antigen/teichoic acid export membrane protein